MGTDAAQRVGVAIRRLPREFGQTGREVHGVLAGAAGDLEHPAARRQDPAQDGQDRVAVAGDRGRGLGSADSSAMLTTFWLVAFSAENRWPFFRKMPSEPDHIADGLPEQTQRENRQDHLENEAETLLGRAMQGHFTEPVAERSRRRSSPP